MAKILATRAVAPFRDVTFLLLLLSGFLHFTFDGQDAFEKGYLCVFFHHSGQRHADHTWFEKLPEAASAVKVS